MGTNNMQAPQVTLEMVKNATFIKCECGGMMFKEHVMFKKISAILSPSGNEEVIPLPVIVCESCGKVPQAFDQQNILPKELKTIKTTLTID